MYIYDCYENNKCVYYDICDRPGKDEGILIHIGTYFSVL